MPIFITLIVVSFILYIYFKVRIISQKDPLTMRFTNAESTNRSRYLLSTFGANQYVYYQTQLALFVCLLFVILGIIQIVYGYRLYKHYRGEIIRLSD